MSKPKIYLETMMINKTHLIRVQNSLN